MRFLHEKEREFPPKSLNRRLHKATFSGKTQIDYSPFRHPEAVPTKAHGTQTGELGGQRAPRLLNVEQYYSSDTDNAGSTNGCLCALKYSWFYLAMSDDALETSPCPAGR